MYMQIFQSTKFKLGIILCHLANSYYFNTCGKHPKFDALNTIGNALYATKPINESEVGVLIKIIKK